MAGRAPEAGAGPDWVPVALAADILPGSAAPTTLFGEELVVWAGASGESRVWSDRCPHRGMRLSFGFVRGEDLACLYHGWRYRPDGACGSIPAHPDLVPPASIRATVYPTRTAGGLVWVWPSAGEAAGDPPVTEADAVPVRSLTVDASAEAVAGELAKWVYVPSFAASRPGWTRGTTHGAAPNLFVHTVTAGAFRETLIFGLQPLDRSTTAVHVLVKLPAEPGLDRRGVLTHVADRCERFGRAVEAASSPAPRADPERSPHAQDA